MRSSTCATECHIPGFVLSTKPQALLFAAYFSHVRFLCFLRDVTVCVRDEPKERAETWPGLPCSFTLLSSPNLSMTRVKCKPRLDSGSSCALVSVLFWGLGGSLGCRWHVNSVVREDALSDWPRRAVTCVSFAKRLNGLQQQLHGHG